MCHTVIALVQIDMQKFVMHTDICPHSVI